MKIISNSESLSKEFTRLMKTYENYYWTTAWADFNFEHTNSLIKYESRIKKVSVGLTFYGTNVQFLKKFKSHIGVNFVISKTGTFHPKVYLFENSDNEFEILIGSANLTKSAFSNNTEFCILINSKDNNAKVIYDETMQFINEQWHIGRVIDDDFINNYNSKKSKLKSTPNLPTKGIFKAIYSKTWKQYFDEIKKSETKSHIELLDWVRNKFSLQPEFHKMNLSTRKIIAGFGVESAEVSLGCFGTTNARGYFKESIIDKPEIITNALSFIPKNGIVTKTNYENFIKEFKKVSKQNELACATRILCLWRPDYFVNFNGKNADSLSKELRISKHKVDYNSYWSLVIQPILNSEWWKESNIKNKTERRIYDYRVALLDCIHYNWT